MFSSLDASPRLLMEIPLKPLQGDRFQPTGFADLGAAVYQRPDGKRMILLESAQSMANRLEHTCLEGGGPYLMEDLKGLPYVHVKLTGVSNAETSSLVEAHRLNSPFIISNKQFQDDFVKKADYVKGSPLNWKKIAETFFHYDPNCLLHGVFMANLSDGRIKVPRAISGFIEAEDVREAASGGVKNNPIDPSGKIRSKELDKDVYGNVPYHRTEYTAAQITAYFNFDLALVRGYKLPDLATKLLIALGLYKIRRLIDSGLRLRTACDLTKKGELTITAPTGFILPQEQDLLKEVMKGIDACKIHFANPPVTQLSTEVVQKTESKETEEQAPDQQEPSEDD